MSLSITFKQSSQENFDLSFEKGMSILDVKKAVAGKLEVEQDRIRLIYKGKILKDADTLESLKVEEGQTFHVVKNPARTTTSEPSAPTDTAAATPSRAPAAATNASPPGAPPPPQSVAFPGASSGTPAMSGAGAAGATGVDPMSMMPGMGGAMNPEVMSQMMSNPMVQQMLQNLAQNPEMLQNMLRTNPMMQQMIASNPQMAAIMQNPEMLRLLFNPQFMQNMMQMQETLAGMGMGMAAGPGAAPGGASRPTPVQPPAGGGGAAQPDFSAMMSNFSMDPMFQAMSGGVGLPGAGGGGDLNAPIPDGERSGLESQYREQLEQLQGMGFVDRDANLNALRMTNGDVESAINLLFDIGGGN